MQMQLPIVIISNFGHNL